MQIPKSLSTWFFIHFLADYIFAIPLFLFPEQFLGALSWPHFDPIAARLVAAALFGIGGVSLLHRKAGEEVFKNMLELKLIWSAAAIIGIGMSFSPEPVWSEQAIFLIFLGFFILWGYYYLRYFLKRPQKQ